MTQTAKYDWLASNSAPAGCPMQIFSGNFFAPDGSSLYIPPHVLHDGWGNSVSIHVVGDDTKSLPDRIEITFYSYIEDLFYHGNFPLPHALIEQLFAAGWDTYDPGPLTHVTFHYITAGVAPGGVVAVWLEGVDRTVEVFFGHADVVDLDFHQMLMMPRDHSRETIRQQSLAAAMKRDPRVAPSVARLNFQSWSSYRTRYPWRPVFEGPAQAQSIQRMSFFNGERDIMPNLPLDEAAQHASRPVPRDLNFLVPRTAQGDYLSYELTFDEAEIFAAFSRLAPAGKPLALVFHSEVLGKKTNFSVELRNADTAVTFQKHRLEIYVRKLRLRQ